MASSVLLHAALIIFTALTATNAIAAPEPVVRPMPPIAGGCRFVPLDPEWPSIEEWASLNISVEGHLIATVPSGSPCFRSTYDVKTKKTGLNTFDEKQCNDVKANWHMPTFHEDSSSSIMQTYFANNSCNPFAPDQSGGQCGIGSYVQYAIDVGSEAHVKAGIAFGKRHNIRVLVRNTGHEWVIPRLVLDARRDAHEHCLAFSGNPRDMALLHYGLIIGKTLVRSFHIKTSCIMALRWRSLPVSKSVRSTTILNSKATWRLVANVLQ